MKHSPMKHSKVFHATRLRLAGLYAGTMGVILALCGAVFYEAMAHSHLSELNHRIESVAGTLHDGLEASLREPGKLEPVVQTFLPTLCLAQTLCSNQDPTTQHYLGVFQQNGYYIRFLDLSGQLLARGGQVPADLPEQMDQPWQTLETSDGNRYRQISLVLKTADQTPWGYMQVGRSLHELDGHLVWVKVVLLIGLPSAMLLVVLASWWIAGQAMQPVYQSYRQMQQFTADAAHELRTPLAAIQATLESTLTSETDTDNDAWETLRTLERQNGRLSKLVQDLLLLSRMDLQAISAIRQPCNLNDLVNDLVEEFVALAIASKVSLSAVPQTHPIFVLGNEQQLYRLVTNLIVNAIQSTPAGGNVVIRLRQNDHYALIHVEDSGIGISSDDQSRIFDRFYRVSSDRSRQTGGAGLGLAIAQAIAQAHQGRIEVKSQLNAGSTFTVQLPLKVG